MRTHALPAQPTSSLRRILYNPNLRGPQRPALDHVPRLLTLQHRSGLLALHRRLEQSLMLVRIKLFPRRIKLHHTVFRERLDEFLFRHFDTVEERDEVLVIFRDGLVDVLQRGGEDVDGREEVRCEALDGKVLGGRLFLFRSTLKVDEVCSAVRKLALQ